MRGGVYSAFREVGAWLLGRAAWHQGHLYQRPLISIAVPLDTTRSSLVGCSGCLACRGQQQHLTPCTSKPTHSLVTMRHAHYQQAPLIHQPSRSCSQPPPLYPLQCSSYHSNVARCAHMPAQGRELMSAAQAKAGLAGDTYSGVYPLLLPLPIPADPPEFLAATSDVIEDYNASEEGAGGAGGWHAAASWHALLLLLLLLLLQPCWPRCCDMPGPCCCFTQQ
jgi:hypothetical protein